MNTSIGVFHRRGTKIQFDPVARADTIKRHREFYSRQFHDVRAFTYDGKEHTGPTPYAENDIRKFIAADGTYGFIPYFKHILGGHKAGGQSCGQARQGSNVSVAYDEFGCDVDTSLHEINHNGDGQGTGLGHSHILRNGKVNSMGDFGSLMGSGTGEVLRSAHICVLGWNKPEETIVVTESKQVLIAPVEMDGLNSNEYKHVIIRVKGYNDFYLSLHQDFPYNRDDAWNEKLYIHELFPKGHPDIKNDFPNTTLRHPGLMPVEGVLLPNGAMIHYLGFEDGIALIDIAFNNVRGVPVYQHNELPIFGEPVESGCYFNPVSSGHGFDVHKFGNKTLIYWYTTRETGEARFIYAVGKSGEELDLLEVVGASLSNPSQGKEKIIGKCRFTGDVFAWRFYQFDKNDRITGSVRSGIKVVNLIIPEFSGIYYDPARNNEGMTVHIFTNLEGIKACTVNQFTYRPNAIGVKHTDTWFSCEGLWNGVGFNLTIYETTGQFMCADAKTKQCGTGTLLLQEENAECELIIDGRSTTYWLTKLE